ncbi:MAG TPA: DUF4476 domain-containing protein [Chitinophagaceae bacterium]|nr:MAG: hypothetical protein UZ11_BCD004000468 [Bacteroidetes bacterium OLB11]HMN33165.1 DUF4476 domain-containing protein [Chitinophagaceae bacterium]
MKNKFFLLLSFLVLSQVAFSQYMPTGNLTIFSEVGNPFYVILNGEQQNEIAQTNIRIEELPQPYYNCKIIFENKSIAPIVKNYLQLADANGIMQDVTYKIKQEKNGKQSLKYFSFIPAVQNMVRPSQCNVYQYGNPRVIIAGPGYSNSLSILDRTVDVITERSYRNNNNNQYRNNQYQKPNRQDNNHYRRQDYSNHYYDNHVQYKSCDRAYPMNGNDFEVARSTVRNEGFDETRLDIAKQIASSNCLSSNQIVSIMQTFGFEATKLEFAKYAYDHCTDPNNYFKVNNAFSFSSSKQELNNYIRR